MIITDHAAERYIERIAPGTSMATAKARLGVHVGSAARLKQKTTSGDDIYISDSLKCRLVVRGSQHGEHDRVVITVLPLDFSAQDNEAVTVDVEEDAPAVPTFNLAQVMQDLINGSSGMRDMTLTGLTRDQLIDVRAENTKRTHSAISRKRKDEITNLNGLAILIKNELRKRPSPPPFAQVEPAPVAAEPDTLSQQVRSLRRELGRMLFKYGWLGNEAAHEVYKSVKGGSDD